MITELELGDIKVEVVQKDIKNVHLSVNPPNGVVRVSAPLSMNLDAIRAFALTKLTWIKEQRRKFEAQEREPAREFLERESHHVWGKRYLLTVVERDQVPTVVLTHEKMIVTVRPGTTRLKIQAVVEDWYRDQLRDALPELIAKWEPILGVKVERLFIQQMKTKWGGCTPEDASLRLNTELARKPPEFLEYVVVHEMSHLIEATHNARFIALMDQHLPNWRHMRDELNRLPLRDVVWS